MLRFEGRLDYSSKSQDSSLPQENQGDKLQAPGQRYTGAGRSDW